MEEQKNTEQTIDLNNLLRICRKHVLALVMWSVGLAIVAWAVSNFFISPKYTSSAQILVNQKSDKADPNAAYTTQQANMQLVTTYKDIASSHVILQAASDRLANPIVVIRKKQNAVYKIDKDGRRILVKKAKPAIIERGGKSYFVTANQLASSVSIATQQQSQVFSINAKANTPEKAKAIANAVAESFQEKIPKIMNVNNVTIVAPATTGKQSFPNVKLFTLAGFVLGFIVSLMVIIIAELANTTVRDDSFLTDELKLTNLGQVAHFRISSSFSIRKANKSQSRIGRRV